MIAKLLETGDESLQYSISATTREPRENEVDGRDYFFMNRIDFEEKIDAGEFLEWADIYGDYYGTPKEYVNQCIRRGKDVILKIDVQGAGQIRESGENGIFVFIAPPSMEELKRRIASRGTESDESLEKRFQRAADEIKEAKHYDYIVVNDDLERALDMIRAIRLAEKSKISRTLNHIKRLMKENEIRGC